MGVKKVAEDLLEWIKNLFRTGYSCPGNSYLNGCINDCKTAEDFDRLADRIVKCLPENDQNGMKQYYDMYMANGMPQQEAFLKTFEHYPIGDYLRYDDLITQIENKEVGISFVVSSVEKQQQMYNELKESVYKQLDEIKKDMKENYNPSFRYSMVEKEQKVLETLATLESHMKEYEYVSKMNHYYDNILSKMDMELTSLIQTYKNAKTEVDKDLSSSNLIMSFIQKKESIKSDMEDIKEYMGNLNSKYAQNRMYDLFENVEKKLEEDYSNIANILKQNKDKDAEFFKSAVFINSEHISHMSKKISDCIEVNQPDRAIKYFCTLCAEVDLNNIDPQYIQKDENKERNWKEVADLFVNMCEKLYPDIQISKEIKDGLDNAFSRGNYADGSGFIKPDKINEELDTLTLNLRNIGTKEDFEAIVNSIKEKELTKEQEPIKEDKEPEKEQSYAERHMDSVDIYVDKTAHDYAYQDLGDFGKLRVVREMQDYVQKANKVREQLKDVSDKETFVNHPEVRKLWGQFREIREDVVLQLATAEASMTLMTDETEKQQMEFAIRKIEDMLVDCIVDGRTNLYKDFIDKGEINELGLDKQAQFLNQIHKEVENEMDFITRDD